LDLSGPERVSRALAASLNAGDIDGVVGLYENNAVFVDYDAIATGLPAIRSAHQQFFDAGLQLALNDSVVFEADTIALVHWAWTVTARDGSSRHGISAEVLRRQADGSWKFIVDNSDGSAMLDPR